MTIKTAIKALKKYGINSNPTENELRQFMKNSGFTFWSTKEKGQKKHNKIYGKTNSQTNS